uniref:Protein MMS22-like n=1 Tax=Anopheles atroparvus TaxID=41427 RepID=A0AAG5DWK5_ANOAO
MFDCRMPSTNAYTDVETLRPFVEDGLYSFGLPFESGTVDCLLDVQVSVLYRSIIYDISKIVRERIQKLNISQSCARRDVRSHRIEITRFLRLVLGFARSRENALDESVSMIKHCLPKPIEPLRKFGWKCVYEKEGKGHEVLHGLFEWHWLILLIAKESTELAVACNKENDAPAAKKHKLALFEKHYRELVVHMLEVVFYQFTINTIEDAFRESPFLCECVKKLWLGMMSLAENTDGAVDFWKILWDSMPAVLADRKDGFLFKIWVINGLAQFYDIKVHQDAKTIPLVKLAPNHTIIDDFLKELVQADCREEHMRTCLILLKPIITGLWPMRYEPVVILWDFFAVRLNSSFRLKNETLSTMACISPSIAAFIEEANTLAAPDSTLDSLDYRTNSFRMFLIILASITRFFTKQANKRNVQIVCNRIFLKLGPKKYENMTEQGVYNHGLLLLTMLAATSFEEDYPRVSKQMQMVRLVDETSLLPTDAIVQRAATATQAHMAVLVLLGNSKTFDKTAHICVLLQHIENAHKKYGYRLQSALNVAAEGTVLLLEKSASKGLYHRGESKLIAGWITKYLQACSDTGWHKLLDAIACAMQNQTASCDDLGKAVKEHLHSFVKERFSKKRPAPPCVPRVAAQLTIFSAKCMDSLVFNSMISNFLHCPTAHSDQVLNYLKEITKCPTIMVLLDEPTVIRQWLKMGLFYGREELLEFSRVVNGLREFKCLCEIPEYDLFENPNEVPVKLFFTYVGKRFREVDGAMQMEMKIKLHKIFQHFDKWIPEPSGIVRQRILSVLVLALKECSQALYIQSNSSCLYHLAFQHYFLPFSVLTDRNVTTEMIEDMAKVWHKVMEVLGSMEYSRNQITGDHVINMLTKWTPQFAKLPDETAALRPLLLFFCARNEELVLFAMPRCIATYVELKRCLPQPNARPVMQMLHRLLTALVQRADHGKTALFIRVAGLQIVTHAFMCNETFPTRALAMETVYAMLTSTDGPSNIVRQEMRTALGAFTRKNLGMAAEAYFTFLCRLVNRNPRFIHSLLDMIREELAIAERLRGQGVDKFLRNWMVRLERVIDATCNEHKTGS